MATAADGTDAEEAGPRSPIRGTSSSPIRPRSPSGGTPPVYGGGSLDGSGDPGRKFADFRMEAAPRWDGERPEEQYREYARTLKLWLIEAKERLPGNLIGKRILDSIPYGSRLSALVSHLTVEEITAPRGWEQVVSIIEDAHEYLKVAKLEQAFNAAIFGGRRKTGQTLTGFLASKRAAFAELKKQGLDLLDSDAGQHLLGHLVLRQGGFTQDERQRIRVLTDGSISFKLVEAAIRKIFNDTLDAVPEYKGKGSYWNEEEDDDDDGDWPEGHIFFHGEGYDEGEATIFEDLMEMDDAGEIYMCLEEALPPMLDETEAIQYAGELVSFVFAETAERWSAKGKGKGKRPKGKGKGRGHLPTKGTKGFGIYGTYADHRKALQDARTGRGYTGGPGDRSQHQQRPRTSLQDLKNRSRCHQCHQMGHWSRDCPQRRRPPGRAARRRARGAMALLLRPTCFSCRSRTAGPMMPGRRPGRRL